MLQLRALLYYLGVTLFSLVYLIPLFLILWIFPFSIRYRLLTSWTTVNLWWLELTCNLHYEVEGLENVPKEGGAIIMAKHQSAWETMSMQRFLPPQTWVLKRELFWVPIIGWGLYLLHSIGIDRKSGRKALQQIVEQGTERLKRGIWVVIFPEGTRVAPGKKGTYHIGGAILAAKSGYPVVPVAHNAGEFWARQSIIKYPGTIKVVVGPIIETQGKKASQINQETEAWIEGKMAEISTYPRDEA